MKFRRWLIQGELLPPLRGPPPSMREAYVGLPLEGKLPRMRVMRWFSTTVCGRILSSPTIYNAKNVEKDTLFSKLFSEICIFVKSAQIVIARFVRFFRFQYKRSEVSHLNGSNSHNPSLFVSFILPYKGVFEL